MNRSRWTAFTLSLTALCLLHSTPAGAQSLPAPSVVFSALIGQGAEDDFSRGINAAKQKQDDKAVQAFSDALKKDSKHFSARFERGNAYFRLKEFDKAAADFGEVVTLKPRMADGYRFRGRAYVQLKEVDKALADFEQAFTVSPRGKNYTMLYADRASAYLTKGEYDKAIADYNTFLELYTKKPDPEARNNVATVHVNRGLSYLQKFQADKKNDKAQKSDVEAALADFDKYVELMAAKNTDTTNILLSRGNAYLLIEDHANAAENYSQYITKKNDDPQAYLNRAIAYEKLGEKDPSKESLALADYQKALELDKNSIEAQDGVNRLLFKSNPDQALVAISKTISNPPKKEDKSKLSFRALIYMNKKDWASAVRDYDAVLKIDPQDKTSYYNRAVANSNLNAPDKALADYDAYLALNPEKPEDKAKATNAKANILLTQQKYDLAAAAYSQVINTDPAKAEPLTYYNRAVAYYNLKQNDKAIADLDVYLKSNPTDDAARKRAIALRTDAELAGSAGAGPEARIAALKKAITADPTNPVHRTNLGAIYLNDLKKPDEAIVEFNEAIKLAPQDATVIYSRAAAYAQKKDWANTIKDTTAALAIKPDYNDALLTRADAYLTNKQYPEAIRDYEAIRAKDAQNTSALKGLAVAYVANKDYANTVKIMNEYIPKNPNDLDALYSRGVANVGLMKYNEGIADLTRYIDQGGKDKSIALYNRGLAYSKANNGAAALADYDASFALKNDYNVAVEAARTNAVEGDKVRDSDQLKAGALYEKAAGYYGKAIEALDAPDSTETDKPRKKADALRSQGNMLRSQGYALENIEILKKSLGVYDSYLALAKPLNLPEVADVEKDVEKIKKYIADNS